MKHDSVSYGSSVSYPSGRRGVARAIGSHMLSLSAGCKILQVRSWATTRPRPMTCLAGLTSTRMAPRGTSPQVNRTWLPWRRAVCSTGPGGPTGSASQLIPRTPRCNSAWICPRGSTAGTSKSSACRLLDSRLRAGGKVGLLLALAAAAVAVVAGFGAWDEASDRGTGSGRGIPARAAERPRPMPEPAAGAPAPTEERRAVSGLLPGDELRYRIDQVTPSA